MQLQIEFQFLIIHSYVTLRETSLSGTGTMEVEDP